MGPSQTLTALAQAAAVSFASPGRITVSWGIARSDATCSTGSWVGPSSPTPIESWVQTYTTRSFCRAASRTAPRM